MKSTAVKTIVKDVLLASIACVIATAIGVSVLELSPELGVFFGLLCAGIPFGWRWMSKVITAVGVISLILKVTLSIFLGWIAIFVVLIGDVVSVVKAKA